MKRTEEVKANRRRTYRGQRVLEAQTATKAYMAAHLVLIDCAVEMSIVDPGDVPDVIYAQWADLVAAVRDAGYMKEDAVEEKNRAQPRKWSQLTYPQRQLLIEVGEHVGRKHVRGPKLQVASILQKHGLVLLSKSNLNSYFASITAAGRAQLAAREVKNGSLKEYKMQWSQLNAPQQRLLSDIGKLGVVDVSGGALHRAAKVLEDWGLATLCYVDPYHWASATAAGKEFLAARAAKKARLEAAKAAKTEAAKVD